MVYAESNGERFPGKNSTQRWFNEYNKNHKERYAENVPGRLKHRSEVIHDARTNEEYSWRCRGKRIRVYSIQEPG